MTAELIHRLHFAFTITFHYLFPQLTMGLALLIVVLKSVALKTGSEEWDRAARFWGRIFAINIVFGARDADKRPIDDAVFTIEITDPEGKKHPVMPQRSGAENLASARSIGEIRYNLTGEFMTGLRELAKSLEMVEKKLPDIVLMDIRLPGMDGIACTRQIKKTHPEVTVLVLSMYDDESHVLEAFNAGANGYLSKLLSAQDLVRAIETPTS